VVENIDTSKIPAHIAIIMDGNGRWAVEHGKDRIFGHQSGVESVRSVIEGAGEIGVKFLTLYAFSTENWSRPKEEIDALKDLGYSENQIVEAVAITGYFNYINTLSNVFALGQ
jgi:undecaprenyl diphosphate synthase